MVFIKIPKISKMCSLNGQTEYQNRRKSLAYKLSHGVTWSHTVTKNYFKLAKFS